MKQLITTSALSLLLLGSIANNVVAKTSPNFPNGFKPQTIGGISFTENKGQVHDQNNIARPDVLYSGTDGQLVFHLKNNGISYQLNKVDGKKEEKASALPNEKVVNDTKNTIYRLDINWLNANTNASILKGAANQDVINYYLGHCPKGALDVKSYDNLSYKNLYPGIDLKWYQKDGHLKYDYLVAAGSNYKQIQLELNGATAISINTKGELVLKTPLGNIIEQAPLVSQNGKILKARWQLKNNIATYEIDNLNPNQAFIIDPAVRTWGTYYGGSGNDFGNTCSVDVSGNVYMAGTTDTYSTLATTGSYQSILAGSNDTYLVKFNSAGVRQWGTYLGGTTYDFGNSCATDGSGNVFLAGSTYSGDFPVTSGCYQSVLNGTTDGFIAKFDGTGLMQWSTFYGGSSYENSNSCVTDGFNGNIYIVGETASNDLPIVGASHQPVYGNGGYDAFLVKFNSTGICQWSTYYGDSGSETGKGGTTDTFGNVYLTGSSSSNTSTNIITAGCHQPNNSGGHDAFLVKFNANGVRQWGTYYGGSGSDYGNSCAADLYGNIYVAGTTSVSTNSIATPGSHQPLHTGSSVDPDAFLVKFDANGVRQWGTYYGGTGWDDGNACATDNWGNIYLSGFTDSNTGTVIATAGSHQSTLGGGSQNAFLAKFDAAGIRQWGTYYGGGFTQGYSCATAISGNGVYTYLAGRTIGNSGIATLSSHQQTIGGSNDAFLVQFYECTPPSSPPTIVLYPSLSVSCENATTTFTSYGIGVVSWYTSATGGSAINIGPSFTTPNLSPGVYTYYTEDSTCASSASRTAVTITVNPNPTITVNSGSICSGDSFTLVPSGATNYTFSSGSAIVSPASTSSYTIIGANAQGCLGSVNSNVTVNPNPTVTINSGAICAGNSFTLLPSGANSYSYSSGNNIVTPTINSSYSVTGTSLFGCTNTAVSNVTVNNLPIITINSSTNLLCVGQTASLTASGANSYNWSTGATLATIAVMPTTTTSYTVSGSDVNGCSNSSNITQQVTICTGISNITSTSQTNLFTVYPNPTTGNLSIELADQHYFLTGTETQLKLQVVNTLGEVLLLIPFTANKATTLNMYNFNNGIYFLSVLDNTTLIKTQKIIKQ